jgi:hypothetical protein
LVSEGSSHTFYFYDECAQSSEPVSLDDWVGTCVSVNGIGIAAISHTKDRVGQTVGYSKNGNVPQAFGTLQNNAEININLE